MSGNKDITINRTAAFKLVYVQLIFTVLLALLSYVYSGLVMAYSVLLGGVVYIVPNIYFVRSAFKSEKVETPQSILSRFYVAEAQKFLLTIVMFAICFALIKPLHAVAFFAAYVLIMVVNLAMLVNLSKNWKKLFSNH